LATELSGIIPKQDILQAYDFVMSREPDNRHNFLFIDLTPKKEHLSPFRMNLGFLGFRLILCRAP
jgi:hypothetical protein